MQLMNIDELAPHEEQFCEYYEQSRSVQHAYRASHDVPPRIGAQTVYDLATQLLKLPRIRDRIQVIRAERRAAVTLNLRDHLNDLANIVRADPNEIVSVRRVACRQCHGRGHEYQWRDESEYLAAVAAAVDGDKPTPNDAGGYGFNPTVEPAPTCPSCFGEGTLDVHIADTTKLVGNARFLYKGAKQKANGEIEVLMHDQMAARAEILKVIGPYAEKLRMPDPPARNTELPPDVSADEAQRLYLELLAAPT